ncbi:hypothetical protein C8J57DRAFT_1077268, partial [Mycena rebaudengoi]
FLTQIPQPMHRNSEMKEILSVGLTSMHSLPARNRYIPVSRCFTHRFGLHLFASTIAIRVILSAIAL